MKSSRLILALITGLFLLGACQVPAATGRQSDETAAAVSTSIPAPTATEAPTATSLPTATPPATSTPAPTPVLTLTPEPTALTDAVYCPTDNQEAAEYFRKGREAFDGGSLSSARGYMAKALELDPGLCDAMDYIGQIDATAGNTEQAIAWFEQSLALNPRNQAALLGLGGVYNDQELYTQAIEIFSRVIELAPEDYIGYSSLGRTYFYAQELELAVAALEQALSLNPNEQNFDWFLDTYALSGAYFRLQDYPNALTYLLKLEDVLDTDGQFLAMVGICYLYGEPQDAQLADDYIQRALDLGTEIPIRVLADLSGPGTVSVVGVKQRYAIRSS